MDIKLEKKPFVLRYKYYIIGGAVLAALLIYMLAVSVGPARLRQDKEDLQFSEAKIDGFLEYLDVEGIVQPRLTVKLNSLEAGTVERIVAEDGSLLRRGDPILILTNPDLLRSIEDERDNLAKQRITYREKLLQMEQRTSELRRNVMKTRYDLDRLAKQYELDKEEYAIGIRSKAQLDVAANDYAFNQENARLLLDELRQDSIKNIMQHDLLQSDMQREEKKFLRNSERLGNLIVRAPIDGQLSYLSVIPGERIAAGINIGELKEMNNMKITAAVSEYYIDRIAPGQPATITYKEMKYPLKISKINPEVKDRNFMVDLLFTDSIPDNVRIGKNYRLQIEMGQSEEALVINKGNFYQSTGGKWVFKLSADGKRAIRTPIVVGRQNPRQYEILEGLQPGDHVIIAGYDRFGEAETLILK